MRLPTRQKGVRVIDCGKRLLSGRRAVTALAVLALSFTCAGAGWAASTPTSTYSPATDLYSMYNLTAQDGAAAWWNAGYTGKGVDVAVIDTGVAPVAGLNTTGKVVYGPDLSLESQNAATRNVDTFGHGTFMAGIIAGHDSTLTSPYAKAPAAAYRGVAPDARIVSLKTGDADGGVDVSQVIAAIDWVVQHAHDPGFNIRVISLSYGTDSIQDPAIDPLAYAAEQAWKAGIVVVAAAGNSGYQLNHGATGIADPADDPFVIGVGGTDTLGTATTGDDVVGSYSASAAACYVTCKNPDFVAPGSHFQGLRVTNGYIDVNHPEGRIDSRYFRGSGTSMSTAFTAGAVALLLQKYPAMTPDQVKAFLAATADHLPYTTNKLQGAGEINLNTLLTATPPAKSAQAFTPSTGTGTLEAARGDDHISMNGIALSGEQDIFGKPFNAAAMAQLEAAGASWSGGTWNGASWSGASWSGASWSGASWSGASWSGASWSSLSWSGNSWSGASWSGASWSGVSWSGASWSGASWSGGSWQGSSWG
jgi:serine protease AprX